MVQFKNFHVHAKRGKRQRTRLLSICVHLTGIIISGVFASVEMYYPIVALILPSTWISSLRIIFLDFLDWIPQPADANVSLTWLRSRRLTLCISLFQFAGMNWETSLLPTYLTQIRDFQNFWESILIASFCSRAQWLCGSHSEMWNTTVVYSIHRPDAHSLGYYRISGF